VSMTVAEAQERLWSATVAAEQGKMIEAMRAVGMTFEWLEDMTVDEAVEVFQVRVHDLQTLIKGENK
jgi:hypothetical protein